MTTSFNPGAAFRQALSVEKPLQIVGTINAYSALLAQRVGYRAIYLSGAGVANAAHGFPDLGITTLNDVLEEAHRITAITNLPLLVDVDTGFGGAFNINHTVQEMQNAGVAAIHIEDQVQAKRCGHRPGKVVVPTAEMCDRIKAAVDARTNPDFIIMARTDALALEGLNATIERISHYVAAGADMIFFEGVTELTQYQALTKTINVPVLANITEFGVTPLFTLKELASVDISMVLYPLSAWRAMNLAALKTYETIRNTGTQKNLLPEMQTREALYDVLDYYAYEKKLDDLFAEGKEQ
jgi:methylisocitrate lyase